MQFSVNTFFLLSFPYIALPRLEVLFFEKFPLACFLFIKGNDLVVVKEKSGLAEHRFCDRNV